VKSVRYTCASIETERSFGTLHFGCFACVLVARACHLSAKLFVVVLRLNIHGKHPHQKPAKNKNRYKENFPLGNKFAGFMSQLDKRSSNHWTPRQTERRIFPY